MTDNSREKILSGVRPKTISSKQVIRTDSSAIESLQPVKILNPVLNQSVRRGVHPISVTMLLAFYKQLEVASQISLGIRSSVALPHNIHVQALSSEETTPT